MSDNSGYIYIIKAETGEYKIGRSKNVPRRMSLFAVKLPFDFEIIHTFPCFDMVEAERQLHYIYRLRRIRGEWFDLSKMDVTVLKSIHSFIQYGEFQKTDEDGCMYGMPELWAYLMDWDVATEKTWYTTEDGKLISV